MNLTVQKAFKILQRALLVLVAGAFALSTADAQRSDPRNQTRVSDCHHEAPPGRALLARRVDSGVTLRGYTAERVLTQIADTRGLSGGEVVVCSEFGRVEIADSDDG